MTDLVRYEAPTSNGWVELMAPAADLARQISGTEFVPTAMRGKPAAVAAAILYGAELGIGPMQALAKIDIVEGRPAPRAELARALCLSAGHEVWVEDQSNTKVTVCGRRKGSDQIQRVTWSIDDAKRAGLDGRPNYKKYPRQMLLARASAELIRMMAPDVLGGIAYFAEELEGEQTEPVVAAPAAPVKAGNKRRLAPAPEPAAAPDEDIVDAEIVDHGDGMTEPQKKMMLALFGDLALNRDDRLSITSTVIGRTISTANELTKDEASKVIDTLNGLTDGTLGLSYGEDGQVAITGPDAA